MPYRYQLEKYSGGKSRHACPNCNQRSQFVRYIDIETGQYVGESVGKCNRSINCNYHYSPKQYFRDHPINLAEKHQLPNSAIRCPVLSSNKVKDADFIKRRWLIESLGNYHQNNLIKFLCDRFSSPEVESIIWRYFVGTWSGNYTVFWQVDRVGNIRTGKLMLYDALTGKRVKECHPSWIHAKLKQSDDLAQDFVLEQCFFGEHLLSVESQKTIAIVESEKTAIVASLFMSKYIWLATGGCENLRLERLQSETSRRIVLFPDSSKFEKWQMKASVAKRQFGLDIQVSGLLERRLSEEQKRQDYDIADFLLNIPRGNE